jgi:hypothetical protein
MVKSDRKVLLKQTRQQHDACMTIVEQPTDETQETEDSLIIDTPSIKHLQDKIHSLEAEVERLTFENQEMQRKGVSAKKEQ